MNDQLLRDLFEELMQRIESDGYQICGEWSSEIRKCETGIDDEVAAWRARFSSIVDQKASE